MYHCTKWEPVVNVHKLAKHKLSLMCGIVTECQHLQHAFVKQTYRKRQNDQVGT
jgi:hypothetical protein